MAQAAAAAAAAAAATTTAAAVPPPSPPPALLLLPPPPSPCRNNRIVPRSPRDHQVADALFCAVLRQDASRRWRHLRQERWTIAASAATRPRHARMVVAQQRAAMRATGGAGGGAGGRGADECPRCAAHCAHGGRSGGGGGGGGGVAVTAEAPSLTALRWRATELYDLRMSDSTLVEEMADNLMCQTDEQAFATLFVERTVARARMVVGAEHHARRSRSLRRLKRVQSAPQLPALAASFASWRWRWPLPHSSPLATNVVVVGGGGGGGGSTASTTCRVALWVHSAVGLRPPSLLGGIGGGFAPFVRAALLLRRRRVGRHQDGSFGNDRSVDFEEVVPAAGLRQQTQRTQTSVKVQTSVPLARFAARGAAGKAKSSGAAAGSSSSSSSSSSRKSGGGRSQAGGGGAAAAATAAAAAAAAERRGAKKPPELATKFVWVGGDERNPPASAALVFDVAHEPGTDVALQLDVWNETFTVDTHLGTTLLRVDRPLGQVLQYHPLVIRVPPRTYALDEDDASRGSVRVSFELREVVPPYYAAAAAAMAALRVGRAGRVAARAGARRGMVGAGVRGGRGRLQAVAPARVALGCLRRASTASTCPRRPL